MATYTASAAQTGVQAKALRVGINAVQAVVSFDGFSSSIATVAQMVKIPAGARIIYMDFHPNVLGEFTLNVGDSVDDERFHSNATVSGAQGLKRPTSGAMMAYEYSADDTISMRISLVSVVTLGGAFYMNVIFAMDAG